MNEFYNDILRRVRRNARVLEICAVVFGMGLYVPVFIWQAAHERGASVPEISPAAVIAWGLAMLASAIIGLRAMKTRKLLRAEKAAYEKNTYLVPQRGRHLTPAQSRKLMQAVTRVRDAANTRVVYNADMAAEDAPYVFQSAPAAYGAAMAICAIVTVLVLALIYAGLNHRYFSPSDQVKEIARLLALWVVMAMCARWYRLKKRGRIPRELQRVSGRLRYVEALCMLAAIAYFTYFIVAYGFAKLALDILG